MDLREARIGKEGALAVALHGSGTVRIHGIGAQEISVSIAASGDDDGMRPEPFQLAGSQVAGDYTLRLTVNHHKVQHLVPRITLHRAGRNLTVQCGVSSQKQLLSGLAAGVESTAHLHAAERTVGQVSAVLACERDTLGNALVDNIVTNLRQTVNVSLAGAVVATLNRIVEKAVNRVVVVLVILGSVDTSLSCYRMRAPGRVADTENLHIIAEFSERGSCRSAAEAGTHHYNLQFTFVVGAYQMDFRLTLRPFLGERSVRNLGN